MPIKEGTKEAFEACLKWQGVGAGMQEGKEKTPKKKKKMQTTKQTKEN